MNYVTVIIPDIEEFEKQFHDFLYNNISVNQLIIHNINIYLQKKEDGISLDSNIFFGYVEKDNEKLMIFQNAYPFKLQIMPLRTLSIEEEKESIASVLTYVKTSNKVIKGINGNPTEAKYFIEKANSVLGKKAFINIRMDIMEIGKISLDKYRDGYLKQAAQEDEKEIAAAIKGFSFDCFKEIKSDDECLKMAQSLIADKKIYLFYDETNTIVSLAAITRKIKDHAALSFVYTFPKYRNKGYASTTVAQLVEKSFEEGFKCCSLFVDQDNPYSNKAYLKVGFKYIGSNYDVVVEE